MLKKVDFVCLLLAFKWSIVLLRVVLYLIVEILNLACYMIIVFTIVANVVTKDGGSHWSDKVLPPSKYFY